MTTYRVVEQKKGSFFTGKMTAEDLESRINAEASQGWKLDRIIAGETARVMGMGDKDVFLLIFAREDDVQARNDASATGQFG